MNGRQNLVSPENFLQVSSLKLSTQESFKPHQHLWKKLEERQVIAQESWVVISGSIRVTFFDLDDQIIGEEILKPGDCSISLEGGHSYTALEDALVYEFKSGPYMGVEADKRPITSEVKE